MRLISLKKIIGIALLASLLWPGQPAALATSGKVETVVVEVTSATPPPDRVAKRMEASIQTVGEHVLLGKQMEELHDRKESYERIVQEVFDRVLVGYSVERVEIVPKASTEIYVTLIPWGDVVREVSLQMDLTAVPAAVRTVIERDLTGVEPAIRSVLLGLPTDAVDWAGGAAKAVVREQIAARLPEFSADVDVTAGPRTEVMIRLLPAGATIKDVSVILRSETIPNILLWEIRPQIEAEAKLMRGLPVGFVQRHADFFRERLTNEFAKHAATRRYSLSAMPEIKPGEDTVVSIAADTDKYRITLEGYLDMDREEDNLALKLHAGKRFSEKDEIFTEVTLIPHSMSWRFAPGWGRKLGTDTEAGLKYDLSERHEIIWMKQRLSDKWSLRIERTPDTQYNEIGVRYRLHEFMSLEYIVDTNDRWLRLVGNL